MYTLYIIINYNMNVTWSVPDTYKSPNKKPYQYMGQFMGVID